MLEMGMSLILNGDNSAFLRAESLGEFTPAGQGVTADPATARRWYAAAVAQENTVVDGEELQEAKAYLAEHS